MKRTTLKKTNPIDRLIPSFKSQGMNLGLRRIQNVLNKMGNPCKDINAIQIAGTNGKGSIACFLESCLIQAGIKAGCTTSPHLMDWCERIKVDGEMISQEDFVKYIKDIKKLSLEEELTPFELVIATAFNYFSQKKVQLLILEVGLGGRLDATTVHPLRPLIAIAGIGLDHCEHLGKTLTDIAKEKAAVITPDSIVISSRQSSEVQEVLEKAAAKKNAKISWVSPLSKSWDLGLQGDIQRENAAVAKGILESLKSLGLEISNEAIKAGLASASWPGRLQTMFWENHPIILDGAHNPHSTQQLSKERNNWSNNRFGIIWIIGIQIHKDAPKMIRHLIQENDTAWIIPINNHKSWNKEELSQACPELSKQLREEISMHNILKKLISRNAWPSPPPVVTGSLYLIGELMPFLSH